jgi:hypothetical protein
MSPQPLPHMPETSWYYHVAYTIALSIYVLYAISLLTRRRRLRAK